MKRISLYIDTDMGVDDIVALCMIIASKKFDIRGISVVNGVASVKNGVNNLGRLLTAMDITCPIFFGANQKQQRSSIQFPSLDRKRANSLALLPNVSLPKEGKNIKLSLTRMKSMLRAENQPFTFFAIGPLTNVSKLFKVSVQQKIKRLIIMGGTLQARGIVPPSFCTEYNVRLDPVAANQILTLPLKKLLVPLDATQQVPTMIEDTQGKTKKELLWFYSQLKSVQPKTVTGKIIKSILLNNKRDFSQFYDPLASALLIEPTICAAYVPMSLGVNMTKSNRGVVKITKSQKSTLVPKSIKTRRFYELMIELIT